MAGLELAKAFAECNDPLDQRHQFELQAEGRAEGDEEAQPLDEEFLEALEYGMPPAASYGMGLNGLSPWWLVKKLCAKPCIFPL